MTRLPVVPVPSDFKCQAVDVREVAARLADLAVGPPAGRVPDIGGPEVSTWEAMVRQYLRATGRRRLVVPVPLPGMRAIREGGLLVAGGPDSAAGRQTWEDFLTTAVSPAG
jgi:uncharacterized protein YbjT (DUF2867 family)